MRHARLIRDESWDAARLVVARLDARPAAGDRVEAFHAVREVVEAAMLRLVERLDRERRRLGTGRSPADPAGETT